MKIVTVTTGEIENIASDSLLVSRIKMIGVREVGRQAGISPSMLSRWMRGKCPMTIEKVSAVKSVVSDWLRKVHST